MTPGDTVDGGFSYPDPAPTQPPPTLQHVVMGDSVVTVDEGTPETRDYRTPTERARDQLTAALTNLQAPHIGDDRDHALRGALVTTMQVLLSLLQV